jgi:hypothetical protein
MSPAQSNRSGLHSFPYRFSIAISCIGLPKEVRWDLGSWTAMTHGNITVSWDRPLEVSVPH